MDTATMVALRQDMWPIRAFEEGLEKEVEQGNVGSEELWNQIQRQPKRASQSVGG